MPLALEMEAQVLAVLDETEQAQLATLLGKLLRRADDLTDD